MLIILMITSLGHSSHYKCYGASIKKRMTGDIGKLGHRSFQCDGTEGFQVIIYF